jgi:hypothetical protein
MVIQSLENIIREELNRHIARINLHKITLDIEQEDEMLLLPLLVIIYLAVRMTTTISLISSAADMYTINY